MSKPPPQNDSSSHTPIATGPLAQKIAHIKSLKKKLQKTLQQVNDKVTIAHETIGRAKKKAFSIQKQTSADKAQSDMASVQKEMVKLDAIHSSISDHLKPTFESISKRISILLETSEEILDGPFESSQELSGSAKEKKKKEAIIKPKPLSHEEKEDIDDENRLDSIKGDIIATISNITDLNDQIDAISISLNKSYSEIEMQIKELNRRSLNVPGIQKKLSAIERTQPPAWKKPAVKGFSLFLDLVIEGSRKAYSATSMAYTNYIAPTLSKFFTDIWNKINKS